ncbi:type I-E CRISPR-associated protein Cse2/CasB [Marinospirillum alkaliphilum]|uniref:CRISPR system Cascade subunit CasB n=1 Tax=Marinospirillum alkaliphilum DSM 21637 TaxID=1122209 RepID=A0A1K1WBL3_9GAMM|nr:type I-E CRISPR-associated protein Cse2/CasB [Marinospirillum alkaliphilum]SFX34213.1 CRISPR system Cascade subunit CasB [Marinospirillum alkaliphilum DSM 21637]
MTAEYQQAASRSWAGQDVLLQWWEAMNLSAEALGRPPAPTAWRAELKRAQSPEAVLLTEGFRNLWLKVRDQAFPDFLGEHQKMLAWAAVAGVLSHVRQNGRGRFAAVFGQKDAKTQKPLVSELRFHQLQASRTPEEFYRRMHRLVRLCGGEMPVQDLAKGILDWFVEQMGHKSGEISYGTAVRWALDYYSAAETPAAKN